PDPTHGVRLPLATGRTVLTETPLELVTHRKKLVQDVIGYMTWVHAKNKTYMPVMEILDFVKKTVTGKERKASLSTNTAKVNHLFYKHPPSEPPPCGQGCDRHPCLPLKGRFARELVAFWSGLPTAIPTIHHAVIQTVRMLPYDLDDP